jgi:hypothetical protein
VQNWLAENWLALVGAVTGPIVLLIAYLSYRYNRNKEKIDLAVSCAPHDNHDENVRELVETEDDKPWERPGMVEVYTVTVTNRGSIVAPLSRVGVVTQTGSERLALVHDGRYMEDATANNIEPLPPKTERTFSLYLKRGEEPYQVTKAFVTDQTGKRWEVNA